jgi:hypothetical protein
MNNVDCIPGLNADRGLVPVLAQPVVRTARPEPGASTKCDRMTPAFPFAPINSLQFAPESAD